VERQASRASIAWAAALAFLAVLPFSDKAVHQDDWAYLRVAGLMLEHGSDVFEVTTLYQGRPISAGQGVLHGPVWMAMLALAQSFGAAAERVAHLLSAGFLALLAGATASIAGRLGARPLLTGLTLALAPAPWVLGTSLMTDLPMLALFSASIAVALGGIARANVRLLWCAGLLGALAALTRYHGLAIVPLLAVLPLVVGGGGRALLPALGAGTLFAGALTLLLAATGRWDMLRATEELSRAVVDREACLMSTVAAIGGVGLGWAIGALTAPGAALRLLVENRRTALAAGLGAAFGAWLAWRAPQVVDAPLEGVNRVLQPTFFVLGGAALGAMLGPWLALIELFGGRVSPGEWRARHGLQAWLALWSLGFAFAAWMTVPFGSTRYVLPALPGVFLLLGRGFAASLPPRAAWTALAATAVLGLGATVADYRAAAIYPRLARTVAEAHESGGAWGAGRTWIWGELGFRWYLERVAGLEVLPSDSSAPRPGDRILKSMVLSTASPDDGSSGRYRLHPEVVRSIESVEIREEPDAWPIRIHNSYAGAGFYGHQAGFMPWAYSDVLHDKLQVWRVSEEDPFHKAFERARRESQSLPDEGPELPAIQGRIDLTRFSVYGEVGERPTVGPVDPRVAFQFLLAGRLEWEQVAVPVASRLELWVGEHHRLRDEAIPGPASIVRVRVDGELLGQTRIHTRGGEPQVWRALSVDLTPYGGREVSLTIEALPDPGASGQRPLILVGVADLRFVPAAN
jgi:hypothetical protein